MGMLIDGVWSDVDRIIVKGKYVRQGSVHNEKISQDVITGISQQPGRFHLIASWTCPWSHRAILMRHQKRLIHHISLHMTGGKLVEGYPANFGKSWQVPGTNIEILHLHQLYTLNNVTHTGRSTVPILWDSQTKQIISDDSAQIIRALDAVILPANESALSTDYTLVPTALIDDLDTINLDVYQNLSNGVYQAGFADDQKAYDIAVRRVFTQLDMLERLLSDQRFLMGEIITEADWRLFVTLVRFDIDYFPHSRCSIRRLIDYPNLWSYARDLYSIPGVSETIDFTAIHLSNYSEGDILPKIAQIDWTKINDRFRFGPIRVMTRSNRVIEINL